MGTKTKVFITGLSALSACGETADATWDALIKGESGIASLKNPELTSWSCKLGAELNLADPSKLVADRKLLKLISVHDVFGIAAAIQAVSHSGLIEYSSTLSCQQNFNENTAIFVGSPGNKYFQQYDFLPLIAKSSADMQSFAAKLFEEVHPMWLLRILPNNVLAYTGIKYGFKGPNHNITNHAVGGAQALIEAYHAIKNGQAQRAVVVAYDLALEPQALYYYDKLSLISHRHLKPFDEEHDGTILGEGAACIVLESEESVKERSACCYGELIGGFSSSENSGLFSIKEDGESLAYLMQKTLTSHDIKAEELAFIVAHGNGVKLSDETEAKAILHLQAGNSLPVTAFKWATGHTIAASGVLDAVLLTHSLNKGCIPGIANLKNIASNCVGLNISNVSRPLDSKPYALMLNRGFASMNACLVIKRV